MCSFRSILEPFTSLELGWPLRLTLACSGTPNYGTAWHAWHGLGLFVVGWMSQWSARPRRVSIAGWCLCIGLVLFSGSLYLMALTGHRWLGAITPLGGTAWIVAWIVLAGAARKASQ